MTPGFRTSAPGGLGRRPSLSHSLGIDAAATNVRRDPFAPDVLNGHLLVVGMSGAGKTSAAKTILARHAAAGGSALVIDPAGDYASDEAFLGAAGATVYGPTTGLGSNPLLSWTGEAVDVRVWSLAELPTRVFALGALQQNVLVDLLEETLRLPNASIARLATTLDRYRCTASGRMREMYGTLYARLRPVFAAGLFTDRGNPLRVVLGEGVRVLALGPLHERVRTFAVALLLDYLFNAALAQGPALGVRNLIVVDEWPSVTAAAPVLDRLVREGRKYGLAVVAISQHALALLSKHEAVFADGIAPPRRLRVMPLDQAGRAAVSEQSVDCGQKKSALSAVFKGAYDTARVASLASTMPEGRAASLSAPDPTWPPCPSLRIGRRLTVGGRSSMTKGEDWESWANGYVEYERQVHAGEFAEAILTCERLQVQMLPTPPSPGGPLRRRSRGERLPGPIRQWFCKKRPYADDDRIDELAGLAWCKLMNPLEDPQKKGPARAPWFSPRGPYFRTKGPRPLGAQFRTFVFSIARTILAEAPPGPRPYYTLGVGGTPGPELKFVNNIRDPEKRRNRAGLLRRNGEEWQQAGDPQTDCRSCTETASQHREQPDLDSIEPDSIPFSGSAHTIKLHGRGLSRDTLIEIGFRRLKYPLPTECVKWIDVTHMLVQLDSTCIEKLVGPPTVTFTDLGPSVPIDSEGAGPEHVTIVRLEIERIIALLSPWERRVLVEFSKSGSEGASRELEVTRPVIYRTMFIIRRKLRQSGEARADAE